MISKKGRNERQKQVEKAYSLSKGGTRKNIPLEKKGTRNKKTINITESRRSLEGLWNPTGRCSHLPKTHPAVLWEKKKKKPIGTENID